MLSRSTSDVKDLLLLLQELVGADIGLLTLGWSQT